jgi:hypothetical protein
MLNILKNKQNIKNKSLTIHSINKEKNAKTLYKLDKNEYKNTIYYPSSTKE